MFISFSKKKAAATRAKVKTIKALSKRLPKKQRPTENSLS